MKSYFSYRNAMLVFFTFLITGCVKQSLKTDQLEIGTSMLAPLLKSGKNPGQRPDEYIVVYKKDIENVDFAIDQISKKHKFKTKHRYKYALKGFAGKLSSQMLAELRTDPQVAYIEEDGLVGVQTIQKDAPSWGIDRLDQRSMPLDSSYAYQYTGAGVDAYIFDTGIRLTHEDFRGRVISGFDAYDYDGVADDDNGHGTHVAGTVGGTRFGVAKDVRLIAVRVLGPQASGFTSDVVVGIDWATNHHTNKPAVGNLSLGTGSSRALEEAVQRMIADGITVCVAAGNQGIDAEYFTPARVVEAITVGASDDQDNYRTFSNYGPRVDVFAPGVNVHSAWFTSDTDSRDLSGTSMATPHVAGTAALYLETHPQATPAEVENAIRLNATPNLLKAVPEGTPNLLLNAVWSTPPVAAAPFAPALLLPVTNSVASIAPVFTWNSSASAISYELQISSETGFSSPVYTRLGISGTSASGMLLNSNTQYYWRVRAFNAVGSSPWSFTASFATSSGADVTPFPRLPVNGATMVIVPTTFSWYSTTGARSYRLQVSSNPEFTRIVYNLSNFADNSTTVKGLAPNTTYYWRVSANYLTFLSPWSQPTSFRTWGP